MRACLKRGCVGIGTQQRKNDAVHHELRDLPKVGFRGVGKLGLNCSYNVTFTRGHLLVLWLSSILPTRKAEPTLVTNAVDMLQSDCRWLVSRFSREE